MKILELRKALAEHCVLRRAVNIDGIGETEGRYCLEKDGKYSIIYRTCFYERGEKNSIREFGSEDEACNYFLAWVLSDPSTRSKRDRLSEPKA